MDNSKIASNIEIFLNDDQLLQLEKLSALDYSVQDMAIYFLKDPDLFERAANNPESAINYHIRRGKLMSAANEQIAILASAESGSISASERIEKIRRNKSWAISKADIFAGFENDKTYRILENFIQSGGSNKLSQDETIHMEALTLMASMDRKYGRRNTILTFTKPPFNLKMARASEMFDEAINLFYIDREIEKKAMRHKLAERTEEAALLVMKLATSAKDLEIYDRLIARIQSLLQLDKEAPAPIPKEMFLQPFRLFTLEAAQVGIPGINRQEVADQIDAYDIPEREKIKLRGDAMLTNINFEENLDELEEKSKYE